MSSVSTLKVALAAVVVLAGGALSYLDVQLTHSQDSAASLTLERDQLKAAVEHMLTSHDGFKPVTAQVS